MTASARTNPAAGIRPAPRRELPYDDELPARHLHLVPPGAGIQDPLPFGEPEAPLPWPLADDRLRTTDPIAPGLSDPAQFSRRLLIAVLEAMAGRRAPQPLVRYVSQPVYRKLFDPARAKRLLELGWRERPTVHRVHVGLPSPDVAEVAAVVRVGDRVRAAALRLEARDGRWRCSLIQFG